VVICAGGFVRITESGMGCPDWPKCFGQWIPPTSAEQLPQNYKDIYSERGYDKLDFNVFNTWAEYVNRLLGAIAGFLCLGLFLVSFSVNNRWLILLSGLLLFLLLFQAWMGALVVYSILQPFKITIHMLVALCILSLLFFLFKITNMKSICKIDISNKWIIIGLLVSFMQIILGTQVRENVDLLLVTYDNPDLSKQLPVVFNIHKTIAFLVFISNAGIVFVYRNFFKQLMELKGIICIVFFLIISGLLMTYSSLGVSQLIHLTSAFTLFILQFSILLKHFHFAIVKFP